MRLSHPDPIFGLSRASILVGPLFSYSYELLFPQPISFHNHPHCPGVWGLCVLGAPTSVPSVLSPFLPCGPVASVEKGSAGERSNLNGAWMQSGESSETTEVRDIEREKSPGISRLSYLFAVICSLFCKTPGWGVGDCHGSSARRDKASGKVFIGRDGAARPAV